ncbi:MAG: hypothetical protein GXO77_00445 [Calditrichaeota bacterium]|nr:hypothetical protein [Calditrichota bacterium]
MNEKEITSRILKKRALLLARRQVTDKTEGETIDVIVFFLGEEKYAVEATFLKGIRPLKNFTFLPGLPPFIKGIVSFFGVLYTIIDLKSYLEIHDEKKETQRQLLIIEHPKLKICFLIDQILEFKSIDKNDIQTDIAGIKGFEKGIIKGITADTEIILEPGKILEDQSLTGKFGTKTNRRIIQ